ncbi:M56 family metallopeptidase [Hymenobacter sp. HD11105]
MSALLLYLLQANAALLLFAGLYYLGLRRLTFYGLNRAYLLFALLFSALYPVLNVTTIFAPQVHLSGSLLTIIPNWTGSLAKPAAPELSWESALVAIYCAGVAVMGVRLIGQLASLYWQHRTSVSTIVAGQMVRCLPEAKSPFSFGSIIYLNPEYYPAAELPAILHHELVHVRQWHTLDILLAQIGQVFCWFNPVAWWLGRAVQQNLEFLTDAAVLRTKLVSLKAYQYSLLRLSGLAATELANHFTFLTLKSRITMMNKPASARAYLTQYALVLPLVMVLLLAFAPSQAGQTVVTGVFASTPDAVPPVQNAAGIADDLLYYLDGKKVSKTVTENIAPESIASINVLKGERVRQVLGNVSETRAILITTKANENAAAVIDLNKKLNRSVKLAGKLLLVDDKEVTQAEFERFLPAQIRQVTVLTPEKAMLAYGEKGKNGSVQILTN